MLQVYTGDGKGKTTAALGMSLRAAGAGLSVFFAQFMKNVDTSELESLKSLESKITVKQFGTGKFVTGVPTEKDYECARQALAEIVDAIDSGLYDMVIADEICTALHYGLIGKDEVMETVRLAKSGKAARKTEVELVFTGRYAGDELISAADIVTEMREVKHCYRQNEPARRGIEY